MLSFHRIASSGEDRIAFTADRLVIGGWAGRDMAAVEHHIEELAALGVPRPSSVPVFYRGAAALLTQAPRVSMLGEDSSGEVEPVLVSMADGLWVGVGSDHTDRKAEAMGVALSKQLCGKPVGTVLWRFADVEPHWDQLVMKSWATIDGKKVRYQEGTLAALRPASDMVTRFGGLPAGTVMFCGTLGAIGGIRPATRFEMELHDPVLNRSISHAYDIDVLPVVS